MRAQSNPLPVLIAFLSLILAAGCDQQQDRRTTERSVDIDTSVAGKVQMTLDGEPLQAGQVISAGTFHVLGAAFELPGRDGVLGWDTVQLLLVRHEVTAERARVVTAFTLGALRQSGHGRTRWECDFTKGSRGRRIQFSFPPGRYELRLCLTRMPKTVQELVDDERQPYANVLPIHSVAVSITR